MITECLKLLRENTAIRMKYQQQFSYILADEFQDINFPQYQILKLLALPENNLFVVGDDDQAIYGFRGATPGIMKQFTADFDGCCQIMLTENYRSKSEIVNLAEKVIKEKAVAWSVTAVSHKTIDKINILNASLLAMKKCYEKIRDKGFEVSILLCDGNKTPDVDCPVEAIVKGDGKIPEIMAASILAKNHRDRLMVMAHEKWPQYGFNRHNGYPTKEHYEALGKYGPCPIHRLTFRLTEKKEEREKELF